MLTYPVSVVLLAYQLSVSNSSYNFYNSIGELHLEPPIEFLFNHQKRQEYLQLLSYLNHLFPAGADLTGNLVRAEMDGYPCNICLISANSRRISSLLLFVWFG